MCVSIASATSSHLQVLPLLQGKIQNDCLGFSAPFYFSIQLPMAVRCWSCILRDDTKELCWGTMSSNFANFRNVSLGSRSTRQNFHLSIQLPIAGTCNRLYGIRPSCLLPATRSPGSVEKRRSLRCELRDRLYVVMKIA